MAGNGSRKAGSSRSAGGRTKPNTSGMAFERRLSRMDVEQASKRRNAVEGRREQSSAEFGRLYDTRSNSKLMRDRRVDYDRRYGRAINNRQINTEITTQRARKALGRFAQFQSEYTNRPRYSTVRNPAPGVRTAAPAGVEPLIGVSTMGSSAWRGFAMRRRGR